ncbi:MAG: glycoside hydrolase family 88 protein [Prevotella sp.]|nr:glycoside hydrolase family 88 protein [Prevotella sp.]
MKKIASLIAALFAIVSVEAQTAQEVLGVAQKANDYFMTKYDDPTVPTNVGRIRPSSLWTRAVYYEGLMELYKVDAQQRYIDYTDRWAEFHQWTPRNGITSCDADDQCCEQTYLDRYMMTKDEKMIVHVKENLAHQMKTGNDRKANGALYGWWTWIDAIQMAMPVYSKMYRITGEQKYIDHAMRMYTWSRDTLAGGLFNTKEGLWWRDADYVPPYKEKDGQNCYWSRGSGWVYAALVRVLEDLEAMPKLSKQSKKYYKSLKKDFVLMSQGLLACQREDGFWNPSLMSPVTYGGKELTGTALFLYGMSWGMNHGILKAKQYRGACDRAWNAMAKDAVHRDGFLGWVQGTGKDPSAGQPLAYDKVPDFEDYGTGCFLLGAVEYYRLLKK